ncbi:MAG: PP2C family protein-serine/threonine phosphatase [Anaerolineales bacterium]
MKSLFKRDPQKKQLNPSKSPVVDETISTENPPKGNLPSFAYAFAQSNGIQRDHNEDALIALTSIFSLQDFVRPFGLFAIADGMGGHLHGDIASKLAIGSITSTIIEKILVPYINPTKPTPQNSLHNILNEAVLIAHQEVLRHAIGGGTTLTACLLFGSYLTIAHVGDSRAYLTQSDASIQRLTRDHSLVNRLIELGQITEKQAVNHPQRNVLYRALGQNDPLEADIISLPIPDSGFLLICSDGLWSVVPDQKISEIVHKNTSLQLACNELIQSANQAGGPDNISVILVKFNG